MITNKDTNMMIDLIVAAYGDKAFPVDDPKKLAKVMNLWSVMFQDDEPREVLLAVKNCIATLSFPPRVADIKSRIAQSRLNGQMSEMEAWSVIRNAVRGARNGTDANQAFMKLPPILQKCVGNPSQIMAWGGVSIDTFEGVIASNFMRSYRETAKNEAMYNALPKDMQSEQSYLNPTPKEVTMLPEPAPQKTFEERDVEMNIEAQVYRERQGIEANPEYDSKVADFLKPMTDTELKMFEAKKRHEDALRMNSWR